MEKKLEIKKITILVQSQSSRADQALLENLRKQNPGISRNLLKSWFQDQKIYLIDNQTMRPVKPALMLTPGQYEIQIHDLSPNAFDEPRASPSLHPEQIQIVFENDQWLVLNKPSGMPSVPHDSNETETAVGLALAHSPELSKVGRKNLEPGLLHRLDTGTSGLLVFAKSQIEFERLSEAWKKRAVQKTYRAWVSYLTQHTAFPYSLPLTVNTQLAHDAKSSKRMVAWNSTSRTAIRGKPLAAITHLLSLHSKLQRTPQIADLEIKIDTGVMHQIRCHLASLECPILGDPIYGGSPSARLWLHAWRLVLPTSENNVLELEAPLPPGWSMPKN